MGELAPGPAPSSREEAITNEIEGILAELRRIDSRLGGLFWAPAAATRRRTGNLSWSDIAFDIASAERDAGGDGDAVASRVLNHKREGLLLRLGELRSALAKHGGGQRKGWG